ncbi:MAG TPA: rhomboid family intramembrane serine protease [Verrucomicrobiae bacterium]|nr:rhomboid family intramembrane serine protease [Verrucomicrobiae bacterium]
MNESAQGRIAARSRRQAMDWSLVLISQGIESTIEHSPETGAWELVVPEPDNEKAVEAIRLYEFENRRWGWRQDLFQGRVLFDWASLAWVFLICVFYWLDAQVRDLRSVGVMQGVAVSHGQWWRLFTSIWLHADPAHLAGNAIFGFTLLGLAMARYGTGIGLLGAYLAGVAGNGLVWLLSPGPGSLGASGMVMGALGLLAAQSFRHGPKDVHSAKYAVIGLIGGVLLFVLLGFGPETDIRAHFGGFVAGTVFGALLSFVPRPAFNVKLNILCGVAFTALVLWPWWHALSRYK